MVSKFGILFAVTIMALAVVLPMTEANADDSDFSYKSQLDDNGYKVYKEVSESDRITDSTREYVIGFDKPYISYDEAELKKIVDGMVQDALSAVYLSNPMVPYIWDYPAKKVSVDIEISTHGEGDSKFYSADKVTFSLSVPEGITEDSMKQLDEAISSYKISGSTNADKVSDIMSQLDKLKFKEDEEGKISNIYSALVLKETTSAGVAQALKRLCDLNNIPAIIVAGDNMKAEDENKSFWNYVYLEGDHHGDTYFAWYVVDSAYCTDSGICGYQTPVDYDGSTYSMSAILSTDLDLSSENNLKVPKLNDEKYVRIGGPSFWELYGDKVMLVAVGGVVILGMLYAVRKGIY